jgi:hypothetical protein
MLVDYRRFFQLITFIFLLSYFHPKDLSAAKIDVIELDKNFVPLIMITGEIVNGDARTFELKTKNLQRGIVGLSSPGGLIKEALDIGAQLNTRGFSTTVADVCVSACGLIWLSGKRLYLNNGTKLGFHAAYIKYGTQANESGVANAQIGSFLTQLGYSLSLIEFVTIASPNELRFLTRDDALRLGIHIEPSSTGNVSNVEPMFNKKNYENSQQKKLSFIATYISHLVLTETCKKVTRIDYDLAMSEHKRAMEEGINLNDPRFDHFINEELTLRSRELKRDGIVRFCDTEKKLFNTQNGRKIYIQ